MTDRQREAPQDETVLACSFDLRPIPPRRRARGETYCSERCRRETHNWRRREARKASS